MINNKLTNAILGFVVGDALGVPVEFQLRAELDRNPVVDMCGYGTYNQPAGTWSDDSSMTLATIDALNRSKWYPSPEFAFDAFRRWLFNGEYTPYGEVFDIGRTTRNALVSGHSCDDIQDNGNGALMRILPLAFLPCTHRKKIKYAAKYAALTHGHELNLMVCEFFTEIVDNLICGVDDWLESAYLSVFRRDSTGALCRIPHIGSLSRDEIKSTGYVIDTLEAALWCFITTDNYRDAVLTAVNLGRDTDTIAAITGGLAGLKYGYDAIPIAWLSQIPRLDYIEKILSDAESLICGV